MPFFKIKKTAHKTQIYLGRIKLLSLASRAKRQFDKAYAQRFSPTLTDQDKIVILSFLFEQAHGYHPNILSPRSFNEKIQWLKIYGYHPLMDVCADKYLVKNYVAESIGEKYVIPLVGVWDAPSQINFSKLPKAFVLKYNAGSSQNIIVQDKHNLNIPSALETMDSWMHPTAQYYYRSLEPSYKNIQPKIICEPYITDSSTNLTSYKLFIFGGKVEFIEVIFDEATEHPTAVIYDLHGTNSPLNTPIPNTLPESLSLNS